MLIDLYRQGRLPLDAFVTEEIGIGDVEAAFDRMHGGDVLRSVVIMGAEAEERRPNAGPVDHAVTSGTFSLDGETFDVENNVWLIGDDDECAIIDAPHNVETITQLVAGPPGQGRSSAPMPTTIMSGSPRRSPLRFPRPTLLHPDDLPLWQLTDEPHPTATWPTAGRSRWPGSR